MIKLKIIMTIILLMMRRILLKIKINSYKMIIAQTTILKQKKNKLKDI
jgi:hypothetical protein